MSKVSKIVFDNVEEINEFYGVNLKIPKFIPEGCNLLCYQIVGVREIVFFHHYKIEDSLYHYDKTYDSWVFSNNSLEQELSYDKASRVSWYIYLRIEQKVKSTDEKLKFTPERLLGVLTTGGHIKDVNFSKDFYSTIKTVQLFNKRWYCPQSLGYYISDVSDETVSFDEYVKLFYNVEGVL